LPAGSRRSRCGLEPGGGTNLREKTGDRIRKSPIAEVDLGDHFSFTPLVARLTARTHDAVVIAYDVAGFDEGLAVVALLDG
jgi:hypothetical protein